MQPTMTSLAQPYHIQGLGIVLVMLLGLGCATLLAWLSLQQTTPLIRIRVGASIGFEPLLGRQLRISLPTGVLNDPFAGHAIRLWSSTSITDARM